MSVDFSKMTVEVYNENLRTREIINSTKIELAMLEITLNSGYGCDELNYLRKEFVKLTNLVNELDQRLIPYEI